MAARSPTARRMPCAATRRSSTPISVWRAHELLYRSRRRRLARGGDVLARRARLRHHLHGLELGIPDVPMEWLSEKWNINISQFDLFAAAVAGVMVAVLALLFQKTRIGRALRAVADDHQAALAVGIPLQHIWAIVWAVAGFVALVAGVMWGVRNGVQYALTFVALKALPVLILGGFESILGAIIGGLIIGAGEKLAEVYLGPYVGGGIESCFAYVIALLFLLVRPEGLFGEKHIDRV